MIKKLVRDLQSDWAHLRACSVELNEAVKQRVNMEQAYRHFELEKESPFWWLYLLEWAGVVRAWFWRRVMRCQHPAPHYHDESYGGPDSGCMAGHCDRCGFGFHTTLY